MISAEEIKDAVKKWEQDPAVFSERYFEDRADIIEEIDFQLDVSDQVLRGSAELNQLYDRMKTLKSRLRDVDRNLFLRLRNRIKDDGLRQSAFKNLVNEFVRFDGDDRGYDNLDLFINGLFSDLPVPEPLRDREPGMVYYQKTPARIVFEMADYCVHDAEEIFVDIGSGLGQVVILMQLLTGMTSTGIEFEPSYCQYARGCASALGLPETHFINENALQADYSKAKIFFLYTPFVGAMMQQVLELLRNESLKRTFHVFTYGPCSAVLAKQGWLRWTQGDYGNSDSLCRFVSKQP